MSDPYATCFFVPLMSQAEMWALVAAGILGASLCIDPCTTMVLVVLSVALVAFPPPTRPPVARVDGASARLAETSSEREEGEKETAAAPPPSGAGREMVENPRRQQREPPAAPTSGDAIPRVTLGGVPPPMSTAARDRLMRTMGAELRGGRLHQFEDPRISSSS